jgi:trehalose-6-phosphate synthase
MNLVAKEFVASQTGDSSVLILSEFAGAAQELRSSLLVNPYDIDQIAQGLRQAVEMSPSEKKERFAALRANVESNNLAAWSQSFLGALLKDSSLGSQISLSPN